MFKKPKSNASHAINTASLKHFLKYQQKYRNY